MLGRRRYPYACTWSLLLSLATVGCSMPMGAAPTTQTAPTPSAGAPTATATDSVGYNGKPVDKSIAPISRSDPSPAAKQAMDACQIDAESDAVAGAGLVPSANRVREYAGLTGREPELATSNPAWVFQISGPVPQLLAGETWLDPICVVVDGTPSWFATGEVLLGNGATVTPLPIPMEPIYALPPLAP
jgi:hypothetical protein